MARRTLLQQDALAGMTPEFTCTATEQVFDLVYISATDTVAQADASDLAKIQVVGWVLHKPDATSCRVSAQLGPVAGASGLTPGDPVYLSDTTPGGVTGTPPAIAIFVGIAITATTWAFYRDLGSAGVTTTLTQDDKALAPSVTTGDEADSGLTITNTPANDSFVIILVNGLGAILGDGVKTGHCYFSGDGGTTARAIGAITAGDGFFWNGDIAGYDLAASDTVDFNYLVAA